MQFGECQAAVITVTVSLLLPLLSGEGVTKFNWIYRSVFSFPFPARFPERPVAGRSSTPVAKIRGRIPHENPAIDDRRRPMIFLSFDRGQRASMKTA